jgi:hypothetical protein
MMVSRRSGAPTVRFQGLRQIVVFVEPKGLVAAERLSRFQRVDLAWNAEFSSELDSFSPSSSFRIA